MLTYLFLFQVQIDYAEALFKECQSSTESSQINQERRQHPSCSDSSQINQERSQRPQKLSDSSNCEIPPENSQRLQYHSESNQRSQIKTKSSQSSQIYSESKSSQLNNDSKEIYSTDDEYAKMD